MRWIVVVAALAAMLAGCGSDDGSGGGGDTSRVWDESEIMDRVGITTEDDGVTYQYSKAGQTCEIAVIMTSASMVETYESAGDTVAKNPSGTAGVKITDAEKATCQTLLTEAFTALDQ